MKIKQSIAGIVLQLLFLAAAAFPQTGNSVQLENFDIAAFVRESVLKTNQANFRLISDYTYKMRRTINTPDGKTTSTLVESYVPSRLNRQSSNRGIIIVLEENGVPLPAKKVEKQRREAAKKLEKAEKAPDANSTLLEAKRENGLPLDWTNEVAIGLSTFLEVCRFDTPRREIIEGRETISLEFSECKAEELPETKVYLAYIAGKIQFDAADKTPIRLEARPKATHLPNGSEISPKTSILFTQQRVADGVWLPSRIRVEGIGGEAVFPTLKLNWQLEFFDYKLPETEIKEVRVDAG